MSLALEVPEELRSRVVHHQPDPGGEDGETWLRRLPRLVARLLADWRLQVDGPPRGGHAAIVLPVRRHDGHAAVLKVTWPHHEARTEHLALRAWSGRRSVGLLAADPGRWAMLLERLDADRDLDGVDVWASCRVVGGLLSHLDIPALPQAPRLSQHLTQLAEDCARELSASRAPRFPPRYLEQARALSLELAADPGVDARLVHADLHGQNVLHRLPDDPGATGGEEDWVAIDPQPMAAQPAFAVAPLLWNRWAEVTGAPDARRHLRRRLEITCETAGLDQDAATAYSVVRMVRNALWALDAPSPHTQAEVTSALTVLKALEPA